MIFIPGSPHLEPPTTSLDIHCHPPYSVVKNAVIHSLSTPPKTKRRGRHPDKVLSAAFVRTALLGRHADGNGEYLFVQPTGTRSWVQRLVVHGRRRAGDPEADLAHEGSNGTKRAAADWHGDEVGHRVLQAFLPLPLLGSPVGPSLVFCCFRLEFCCLGPSTRCVLHGPSASVGYHDLQDDQASAPANAWYSRTPDFADWPKILCMNSAVSSLNMTPSDSPSRKRNKTPMPQAGLLSTLSFHFQKIVHELLNAECAIGGSHSLRIF